MSKAVFYIFLLIGTFLVATNATKINEILKTLSDTGIKGTIALQGRDIKGVTY